MKKTLLTLACAAIAPIAFAQTTTQSTTTTTSYIPSSKVVGSKVRVSSGEEVGVIKDVVLDRDTGCMAYTVLTTSGGGSKTVAVPWSVYSPASEGVYTVQVEKEKIYAAPVYDYARIEEYSRPEYFSQVYSYYGVQPAVGVGLGASTNVQRGATGTTTSSSAAATGTTSPAPTAAATTSPGATATATASASPAATAAASPKATAAASPRVTATAAASPATTASPRPAAASTKSTSKSTASPAPTP